MGTPEHSPHRPDRPRVLHVVQTWDSSLSDPVRGPVKDRCDAGARACANAIRSMPDFEHTTLVLAGASGATRAHRLGLTRFDRIAPILGRPALAARSFHRYAFSRGPFDIVHLWGESLQCLEPWRTSAPCVAWSDLERGEVCLLPSFRTGTTGPWGLPLTSISTEARHALVESRQRVRARLGIGADEIALVLLADPPDAAQISRFSFLATLLRVSGLPVVAVTHSHGLEEARGFASQRAELLDRPPIVVDGPIEHVLSACDVGVCTPGTRFCTSPEPASWRLACLVRVAFDLGVPVVTPTRSLLPQSLAESLADRLVAHSPHPAAIARAVARLCDDRAGLHAMREQQIRDASETNVPDIADVLRQVWASALGARSAGEPMAQGVAE